MSSSVLAVMGYVVLYIQFGGELHMMSCFGRLAMLLYIYITVISMPCCVQTVSWSTSVGNECVAHVDCAQVSVQCTCMFGN